METMLLLVLLMMNSDEQSRDTIQSLLRFYRENKDLIATLLNTQKKDGITEPPGDTAQPPEEPKENRPREEAGNTYVIEEYLKRFSV